MNPFKATALLSAISLVGISTSHAALTITDGDIVGDTSYVYSLSFADFATPDKFTNDVFQSTGVSVVTEGAGAGERRFVSANVGLTSASLTYAFDFSSTGYRPTEVSFTEYLLVNIPTNWAATGSVRTEYSFDNENWTQVRLREATASFQTSNGTIAFETPTLPDVVYYRATYSITGTNQDGNPAAFPNSGLQWARQNPAWAPSFVADFAVTSIPEPSAFAALAGVLGLGIAGLRRRGVRR